MSYPHLQAGAFRALLSGPPFWVNSSMLSNGLQNRRLWGENPLHLPTIHDDCTGETMQSSYHTHDGLSSVWLLALLFHHHGLPPGELPWISRHGSFSLPKMPVFMHEVIMWEKRWGKEGEFHCKNVKKSCIYRIIVETDLTIYIVGADRGMYLSALGPSAVNG